MPRAAEVGKRRFDKERTIEGYSQSERDSISFDEAEERSAAAEPFERETSRSSSNQLDARRRLQLRGCFDSCKRLFLDTGGEQMEIDKELIDACLSPRISEPAGVVSSSLAPQSGMGSGIGVTTRSFLLHEFPQCDPCAQKP